MLPVIENSDHSSVPIRNLQPLYSPDVLKSRQWLPHQQIFFPFDLVTETHQPNILSAGVIGSFDRSRSNSLPAVFHW